MTVKTDEVVALNKIYKTEFKYKIKRDKTGLNLTEFRY